jgi:hypothetical protein
MSNSTNGNGDRAKGLLFKDEMARAIWRGEKNETRRLKGPWHLGQRLYVKETWTVHACAGVVCVCSGPVVDNGKAHYRANGEICPTDGTQLKWKSSIFMPRWASRMELRVTGARMEALQAITEGGARAEGFTGVADFAAYWRRLHGVNSWDANPVVWVVGFEVDRLARTWPTINLQGGAA